MLALPLLALCLASARADTVFPAAETPESRMISWRQRKDDDRAMQDEFNARAQVRKDWNAADKAQVRKILDEVWGLLESVESKQRGVLQMMTNAVDQKAVLGQMDASTAADLKWRLDMVYTLRMYYLYANMWPRIMEEGFGTVDPNFARLFGERCAVAISDAEFHALADRYDFDPARYGLPKPPATEN